MGITLFDATISGELCDGSLGPGLPFLRVDKPSPNLRFFNAS